MSINKLEFEKPENQVPVSPPKCRKSSRTCSSCFFHALWLCPAAGGQGCRSEATKSRRDMDGPFLARALRQAGGQGCRSGATKSRREMDEPFCFIKPCEQAHLFYNVRLFQFFTCASSFRGLPYLRDCARCRCAFPSCLPQGPCKKGLSAVLTEAFCFI